MRARRTPSRGAPVTIPADITTTAVLLGHIANPPRRTTRPAPKGTR